MNIKEIKVFKFSFELTIMSKDGQMTTNPFRFDVQAETQEDAKVKLLQDLQQIVEQIALSLPTTSNGKGKVGDNSMLQA